VRAGGAVGFSDEPLKPSRPTGRERVCVGFMNLEEAEAPRDFVGAHQAGAFEIVPLVAVFGLRAVTIDTVRAPVKLDSYALATRALAPKIRRIPAALFGVLLKKEFVSSVKP
jgi:hypothetical protein